MIPPTPTIPLLGSIAPGTINQTEVPNRGVIYESIEYLTYNALRHRHVTAYPGH